MSTAHSKRSNAYTRVPRQKPHNTIDAVTLVLEARAYERHAQGQHRFIRKGAAG
jgi:hypothetical protein